MKVYKKGDLVEVINVRAWGRVVRLDYFGGLYPSYAVEITRDNRGIKDSSLVGLVYHRGAEMLREVCAVEQLGDLT
jgi:hypothetical protein